MSKYKMIPCHRCDEPMLAATFSDTWNMRVDGKLHQVPLHNVPCFYCKPCDISVVDGSSDEVIQYWYTKYINAKGLNTWRHRLWRVIMRQLRLLESWFYRGPMWQWRRERNA